MFSATYIRYRSTSPTGKPIEVSGAVFLPTGDAPATVIPQWSSWIDGLFVNKPFQPTCPH